MSDLHASYCSHAQHAGSLTLSFNRPPISLTFGMLLCRFSHSTDQIMSDFHKKVPGKPIVSSECCSCETQRGEDADQPLNASTVYHSDEASGCLSGETQRSNGEVYNVGTFIWTLHDCGFYLPFFLLVCTVGVAVTARCLPPEFDWMLPVLDCECTFYSLGYYVAKLSHCSFCVIILVRIFPHSLTNGPTLRSQTSVSPTAGRT